MNSLPCILIPAIVGILCGILGYLLGRLGKGKSNDEVTSLRDDLDNCNRMNSQLRSDLERLRSQGNSDGIKKSTTASQAFTSPSIETELVFDAAFAKSVFGKKVNENDLKIIEGIGPKIEQLFKTSGILTWKSLSETSVDRCREILMKAGERFQIHDPGTWPRQSKLAYENKWRQLKDWQDTLEGGREK